MVTYRRFWVIVFSLLLLVNIGFKIVNAYHGIPLIKLVFLLTALIIVLTAKTRISWLLAVTLFAYGFYYELFREALVSGGGTMDFTYSIECLLHDTTNGNIRYVAIIPLLFYLPSLILFLTKRMLREYCILKAC